MRQQMIDGMVQHYRFTYLRGPIKTTARRMSSSVTTGLKAQNIPAFASKYRNFLPPPLPTTDFQTAVCRESDLPKMAVKAWCMHLNYHKNRK